MENAICRQRRGASQLRNQFHLEILKGHGRPARQKDHFCKTALHRWIFIVISKKNLFCLLTIASALATANNHTAPMQMACNGHPKLCDRALNEIALASSHNSMSNQADGWLTPDHLYGIRAQLDYGIRALSLDVWPYRHGIYLCHKICETGNKYIFDALIEIRTFLEENPNEVIIIVFESYVENSSLADVFKEAGLEGYMYTHNPQTGWPTLREMIDTNRKILAMSDSKNMTNTPDWLHYAYDLGHYTGPTKKRDASGKKLDRGGLTCWAWGIQGKPQKLYWLNHFGLAPYTLQKLSESINYNPYLYDRAKACWEEAGHIPNALSLTFFSQSDLMETINRLNGVG